MEETFAPERSCSLCIYSLCSEICDATGYCPYETFWCVPANTGLLFEMPESNRKKKIRTSLANGEFGFTQKHKNILKFKKLSHFETWFSLKFFQISGEVQCICHFIIKPEQMYMKSYTGRISHVKNTDFPLERFFAPLPNPHHLWMYGWQNIHRQFMWKMSWGETWLVNTV